MFTVVGSIGSHTNHPQRYVRTMRCIFSTDKGIEEVVVILASAVHRIRQIKAVFADELSYVNSLLCC